jgi:hypothetical protein
VTKDRLRRLEKLEAARKAKTEAVETTGIIHLTYAPGMHRALAKKEQWVDDWYVEIDGRISEVRVRITTDPADVGRNYLREASGNEPEDLTLRRKSRGRLLWVVRKPGTKPFPTRIGTLVVKYA